MGSKKKSELRSTRTVGVVHVQKIRPITENQRLTFEAWEKGKNLALHGAAGTGKTFVSLYLALKDVLNPETPHSKVYIVRSLLPTREVGFLPGTIEEKSQVYELPYQNIVDELIRTDASWQTAYNTLKEMGVVEFFSTSYVRGTTLDNCIIVVDEFINMNFHELDSIITRVGTNTRIIFAGDISQSDLVKTSEKTGILDFMDILRVMPEFVSIEFTVDDIVRSGLVKSYLIAKHRRGK